MNGPVLIRPAELGVENHPGTCGCAVSWIVDHQSRGLILHDKIAAGRNQPPQLRIIVRY